MKPASGVRGSPYQGVGIPPDAAYRQRHERVMVTARAAAQAWAVAQQQRPVRKKLAPWDENTYFINPVATTIQLPASTDIIVAQSNPQRVGLILQNMGTGTNPVNVAPSRTLSGSIPDGLVLLNTTLPFMIHYSDWGPLVAAEWHANCPAGTLGFTTIELVLRELPPDRL